MHYMYWIMSLLLTHYTTSKTLDFTQILRSFNLFLRGLVIAILEVWLAGMPPALVPGSLIAHSRLILSCCSSLILMLIAQPYSCAQQRHKDSLSILISLQNPFAISFERMMTNYNHQDICCAKPQSTIATKSQGTLYTPSLPKWVFIILLSIFYRFFR
jgi:hypothetical protein